MSIDRTRPMLIGTNRASVYVLLINAPSQYAGWWRSEWGLAENVRMYARASDLLVRARWVVLIAWAVVLAGAFVLAPRVFGALEPGGFSSPDFESQRTGDLFTQRFGYYPGTLVVLFSAPSGSGLR